MIGFVNGFLCTCSCDVSKAKRGVDPHPSTGDPAAKPAAVKNGVATDDKGAVVLGGSLAATMSATAVAPVSAAQSSAPANAQTPGQIVNVLT